MKLTLDDGREVVLSQELSDKIMNEVNEATKEKKDTWFHDFDKIDRYYHVEDSGIYNYTNYKDDDDNCWHNNLNAFTSEEFAEKIAVKQLMERKLLKFSLEHDGDKIDWDNDTWKYYIFYYGNGDLRIDSSAYIRCQGTIYFNSLEIAQSAIDEFHDDLIKYFQLDFSNQEDI